MWFVELLLVILCGIKSDGCGTSEVSNNRINVEYQAS